MPSYFGIGNLVTLHIPPVIPDFEKLLKQLSYFNKIISRAILEAILALCLSAHKYTHGIKRVKGLFQYSYVHYIWLCQDDREACMRNHTATHILNYCLWKCVGKTRQQGSIVNQHKLTFSFSLETVSIQCSFYESERVVCVDSFLCNLNPSPPLLHKINHCIKYSVYLDTNYLTNVRHIALLGSFLFHIYIHVSGVYSKCNCNFVKHNVLIKIDLR